jgi:hypothetical protein
MKKPIIIWRSRGGEKTDGVLGKWALKERSRLHSEISIDLGGLTNRDPFLDGKFLAIDVLGACRAF